VRTRPSIAFAILAVIVSIPVSAVAEDPEEPDFGPKDGDIEFTLGGNGNNDNAFDSGGFSLATSLGYFFNEHVEAGLRHNMSFFDAEDVDATFLATTRAFTDFHLDFDRFQPFLGANIGIRYGNGEIDETGTIAPEGGIKLFVFENAFVLAMMEYQWFFKEVSDVDDSADDGQFVYTLGLGFNF
jgi:hypothetical protein